MINNALTCTSKITCNFFFCKGKIFKSYIAQPQNLITGDSNNVNDHHDDVHVVEDVD